MKILELRFSNLNSLVGEWRIDFTNPAYEDSGIFAIVGPTGSGKTTILDAICLALYGQTPRLGKITRGSNEIMSRQTAECSAEVLFESSRGRFRCTWSQKRARGLPNGELQQQKHEISDAVTGEVLESKIKDVTEKVRECTGMDFSQFTRSILLAQGGFAAFLNASPADRAPILEQITGTGIYSDISRRVHERTSVERARVALLREEIDHIRMLPPDELEAIRHESTVLDREYRALQFKIKGMDEAVTRLKRGADLERELEVLEIESRAVSGKREQSRDDLDLLRRARIARKFDSECQALAGLAREKERLQAQWESDMETYKACQDEYQVLSGKVETIDTALAECGSDSTLPATIRELSVLIEAIRSRAGKIGGFREDIAREDQLREAARQKHGVLEDQQERTAERLRTEQQVHDRLKAGLAQTLNNRTLREWYDQERDAATAASELASLLEAIRRTNSCQTQEESLDRACIDLDGNIKKYRADLESKNAQIREADQRIAGLEETCRHLDRVRDLEDERARLVDGKPCPLCGSPHHPYAEGTLPQMTAAEQDLADWKNNRSQLSEATVSLGNEIIKTEAEMTENRRREGEIRYERESLDKAVSAGLFRMNLAPDTPDLPGTIDALIESNRRAAEDAGLVISAAVQQEEVIRSHESVLQSAREDREKIRLALTESGAAIGMHEHAHQDLQKSLEREESDLDRDRTILQEKLSPYGIAATRDANLEHILEDLIRRCNHYRSLTVAREQTAPQLTSARVRMEQLRHRIEETSDHLEKQDGKIRSHKDELQRLVTSAGFADCREFLEARIGRERFEQLEQLETDIRNEEIRISTLIRSKHEELRTVREQSEPGVLLETLEENRDQLQKELDAVRERLTGIRVILGQHEEHSRQRNEQLTVLNQQQIESDRWDRLDQLIGSHDGKKFRSFAQGITFEHLIRNANRHLGSLNNRYILVRTKDGHLDMNVVDFYQAGEVRSTKNLSGGETFIVSLALALGLSDMASSNVRVDSLFLDEGFGTLDSESLDMAIDALIHLQTEGKLIGVISHVPALKERIPTQIIVEKKAGGISSLSAPGCSCKGT